MISCHEHNFSAVLQAAGVGDADAKALSAAITWILKDGVGLIGGLFYSYKFSPYFDSHVKEFRLCADIANDLGLCIDMIAPLFPSRYFLLLSSLSTLCKMMCGIAANATKSSITIFLSNDGNVADLNAKESTQETFVSLLGMIGGLLIAKFLHSKDGDGSIITIYAWIYFIILTIVHVWANYKGVKLLRLNTLNRERLNNVLHPFIQDVLNKDAVTMKNNIESQLLQRRMKSPLNINESLYLSALHLIEYDPNKYTPNIYLGTKCISTIIDLSSNSNANSLLYWILKDEFIQENYFIFIRDTNTTSKICNDMKQNIYVYLRHSDHVHTSTSSMKNTHHDECKAYVHAYMIQQYYRMQNEKRSDYYDVKKVIQM